MRTLRKWVVRLQFFFNRSRQERELADEIQANLALRIEENMRAGMLPGEARRVALSRFGSIDNAKEAVREARGIPFLETLLSDVRFGVRMSLQNPGWSAIAILSLALGIGANSALFGIVDVYAFGKLPVRNPNQLIEFRWRGENTVESLGSQDSYIERSSNERTGSNFSYAAFEEFRRNNATLDNVFALAQAGPMNVLVNGEAEIATGQFVTGTFYAALGVLPAVGRLLMPEDDTAAAVPAAVISYQYWQRRFSKDPSILGSKITINDVVLIVVGVSPRSFVNLSKRGSFDAPDIAIPLMIEPRVRGTASWLNYPQDWWLTIMGRMRPNITAKQVEDNFRDAFDASARDGWKTFFGTMTSEQKLRPDMGARAIHVPRLQVVNANRGVTDSASDVLHQFAVLTVIFGIVLLIVCVNLANLLLSRAAARQKEIGVRLAIGASRLRVIRQLMTENLVIAVIAAVMGSLFTYWGMRMLSRFFFRWTPVFETASRPPAFDLPLILFSGALTVFAAAAFGIIPALRATRRDVASSVRKSENRFSPSHSRLGKSLVVVQVALSLVLLVAAGLFLQTLRQLQRVDVGFNPENLALFTIPPALKGDDNRARSETLLPELQQGLLRVPGIRSVSFASPEGLLNGGETSANVYMESSAHPYSASVLSVNPGFFDTMQISLKLGRKFSSADDSRTAPPVAIVNEAFVRQFFPGGNPLGGHFSGRPNAPAERLIEIVGVVADAKINSLRTPAPPSYYRPMRQLPFPSIMVVLRTAADPEPILPAIRDTMHRLEPRIPLADLSTQQELIGRQYLVNERLFAIASSSFGVLALVIATIGLFGLLTYSVARRTKEIGIRMAVGARREEVLRAVLREGLLLVSLGIIIGLVSATALTRFISSLLFGITPYDPMAISFAIGLMISISTLAAYLPARRAANVDPMIALRYE